MNISKGYNSFPGSYQYSTYSDLAMSTFSDTPTSYFLT